MGRPVAPRSDKYIDLDLTLIKYIETSTVFTSRVMKRIGDNINAYDVSDEAVEIETKIEVDIGGGGMQWPEGLIAPDRELELDK